MRSRARKSRWSRGTSCCCSSSGERLGGEFVVVVGGWALRAFSSAGEWGLELDWA